MPHPPVDLAAFLRSHPAQRYWIAFSGGLDSRVLLHLCARLGADFPFTAIHVHHGLQAAADDWADHCRRTADAEGIPIKILRVDGKARPGQSPEEAARNARYGALREHLISGEALLTAQHRDDQAETLLLQLLRGAGPAGLSGMGSASPFGAGRLLRPLLGISRSNLLVYARAQGLEWVDDPSNQDVNFDRNFLRHQILPLLETRWPAASAALARSARHCTEAQQRLDALAEDLLRSALSDDGETLCLDRLREWPDADRRLVVRAWFKSRGFRMPAARVLERILAECIAVAPDRMPLIRWSEGEIRRYRDRLYLFPPAIKGLDASVVLDWDGKGSLSLPDGGRLEMEIVDGPGISLDEWNARRISVGFRRGGETCKLPGRQGSKELKKLFQEAGIPPWIRDSAPLIRLDGQLAAVGEWWVCQPFAGNASGPHVAIRWNRTKSAEGGNPRVKD